MCYVLSYSYRILISMHIFGYFFQNGHFKGSSKGWRSPYLRCSKGPVLNQALFEKKKKTRNGDGGGRWWS